jgi:hypothetical protein
MRKYHFSIARQELIMRHAAALCDTHYGSLHGDGELCAFGLNEKDTCEVSLGHFADTLVGWL